MRLGIAIGFGWFCGATVPEVTDWPWTLALALVIGFCFGAAAAAWDRYTGIRPDDA